MSVSEEWSVGFLHEARIENDSKNGFGDVFAAQYLNKDVMQEITGSKREFESAARGNRVHLQSFDIRET